MRYSASLVRVMITEQAWQGLEDYYYDVLDTNGVRDSNGLDIRNIAKYCCDLAKRGKGALASDEIYRTIRNHGTKIG
jgi:hypothetical protein